MPSEFCVLSEMITDVTNDLLACKEWDPMSVRSNYAEKIPKPVKLPSDVPFEQSRSLSVNIDDGDICKADVFIDDIITVGVDVGDNLLRLISAPCTAMHAFCHSIEGEVHVPRQEFIAEDKNEAEGAPAEEKIVLQFKKRK